MRALSHSEKLWRRQSPRAVAWRIVWILIICFMALFLRWRVIEPAMPSDYALAPLMTPRTLHWFCKLDLCKDRLRPGDAVLFRTPEGTRLARTFLAGPGDSLHASSHGELRTRRHRITLRDDPWFVEPAIVRIPRRGDTLHFTDLHPAEFDLALRLWSRQFPNRPLRVQPELNINGAPAPLEKASQAQINGIPVKLADLGQAPWQELALVSLQILRNEPHARQVQIKRRVFLDSAELQSMPVLEDCYWLSCLKARDCVDSRELGYIPRSWISGVAIRLRHP